MLSPDGRWRWDGVRWVPVEAADRGPMRTRWVVLITAGSIVALLLAGTMLALLSAGLSHMTVQGPVVTSP